MTRDRFVTVLGLAGRLVLGLLLWAISIGLYVRFVRGTVTTSVPMFAHPEQAADIGVSGPYWSVVGTLLAMDVAVIAGGLALGWLTAVIALRFRLDWPHWASPSLALCGVFAGVVFVLGGWSSAGTVFMVSTFGPILVGQYVGVRFSRGWRAPVSGAGSSIQPRHRADSRELH